MNRQVITQDVATHLFEAETALNQAFAKAAKLAEVLACAQGQMNLSLTVGDRTLHKSSTALAAIGHAQSELAAVHSRLDQLRRRLGLRPVGWPGGEKPGEWPGEEDDRDLDPEDRLAASGGGR